jgi:hypothetical protein
MSGWMAGSKPLPKCARDLVICSGSPRTLNQAAHNDKRTRGTFFTIFGEKTKMTKIQEITRKNGTKVKILYLPSGVDKESGLGKGDEVEIIVTGPGVLTVTKIR